MTPRILLILAVTACASSTAPLGDAPASVRERLESADTRLFISGAESGGSITAARRVSGGWSSGSVELTIESGELIASCDGDGKLTIERAGLWLGPIEIPSTVLGHGAQLTKVHLQVEKPIAIAATWDGDDDARATTSLDVGLSWELSVDGSSSPLGAPKLPAIPIELVLTGDGGHIQAELRAHAAGVVWSWADLVRLEDLDLVLAGATVER
jgi:hypothetical protein